MATVKKTPTTKKEPIVNVETAVKKPTVKKAAAVKTPVTETLNTTPAAQLVKKKTESLKNTVSIDVLDVTGKVIETIKLPGEIFSARINKPLMAQAIRVYLANQRRGTVSTKTRGEVEGSTRKIYRQKGTGRARHGSIRAPIFVGGGLVFGPKPRDYSMTLPQKMRKAALFSALTSKCNDKELKIMSGLEALEPKTKVMYNALKEVMDVNKPSVLLVVPTETTGTNVRKAVRNIEGVTFLPVNQLNTYQVLRAKHVIVMKDAVESISTVFGKGKV